MQSPTKDISIITINYNSSFYTIKCIESILEVTASSLNYEIVVIDNASEEQDYINIRDFIENLNHNSVHIYRSRLNTGFGGGNMFGVQRASAKYYLFLNNDTLLQQDAISHCYNFMEHNETAACCGPKIFGEHGKSRYGFNHFASITKELVGKKAVEFFKGPNTPKIRGEYHKPLAVDYVNGSFMFFRASDFDAVGGFDTNIFLYYEESDICLRLKKLGKITYFLPNTSYVHCHDKSIGENLMPKTQLVEFYTSLFYFIKKHHSWIYYKLFQFLFIVRFSIKSFAKPKYFILVQNALRGLPLHNSIKQKQLVKPSI